jgi:hypothetical protein
MLSRFHDPLVPIPDLSRLRIRMMCIDYSSSVPDSSDFETIAKTIHPSGHVKISSIVCGALKLHALCTQQTVVDF